MNQTFSGGGQTNDRPSINPRLREPDVRGSIPDKALQDSKQRAVRAKLENLAKLLARRANCLVVVQRTAAGGRDSCCLQNH